jgi:hypothetical protein
LRDAPFGSQADAIGFQVDAIASRVGAIRSSVRAFGPQDVAIGLRDHLLDPADLPPTFVPGSAEVSSCRDTSKPTTLRLVHQRVVRGLEQAKSY